MDASQAAEARTLRRDLEAASDRNMLQQRELDRLRALLAESRAEQQAQLDSLMKSQAIAEANATKAEAQAAVLRQRLEKTEAELRDAWSSQAQHASVVRDVRAEVATRLSSMMAAIQEKEEELHKAQFQLRDFARLRERCAQLEKMVGARDDAITELTGKYAELRSANDALTMEISGAKATFAARLAVAETYAASARSMSTAGHRQASASPPPPPPPNDPHVLDTAHLVTQCRDWAQETDKSIVGLEDSIEAQFDALQDLRLVLERGVTNISVDLLGSAALNLDRQRLGNLRRTEQRRLEQQLAAVGDNASTAGLIRATIANARFNFGKLKGTVQQLTDYIQALRGFADRHCSAAGIPAMQARWDAWLKARPEPLPMPAMQSSQTPPVVDASPQSSPKQPAAPAFDTSHFTSEIGELTKRLRKAEATIDELSDKLREQRRTADEDKSRLADNHREQLQNLRNETQEERRRLLAEIDRDREEFARVSRAREEETAVERRQHANALAERDRDRVAAISELQSRIGALELEAEQALASKLRDAALLEEAKAKRKAMKGDLLVAQEEIARLEAAVAELNADVVAAHRHIDQLEMELESTRQVLDFEVKQQEESQLDVAAFGKWKRSATHVAAAAEAARLGQQRSPYVAAGAPAPSGFTAGRLPHGALTQQARVQSQQAVFVQRPLSHSSRR